MTLPVDNAVRINANTALAILENISREPKGDWAMLICSEIDKGKQLIVTEPVTLNRLISQIPYWMQFENNLDLGEAKVSNICGIQVGGDLIISDQIGSLRCLGDVTVKGKTTITKSICSQFDLKTGSFEAKDSSFRLAHITAQNGIVIECVSCPELIASTERGGIAVKKLSRGNQTNVPVARCSLMAPAGDIVLTGINIERLEARAGGDIKKVDSMPEYVFEVKNVVLQAGGNIDISNPSNENRDPGLVTMDAVYAVADGNVNLNGINVMEVTITSYGDVDLDNTQMTKAEILCKGAVSLRGSKVEEITNYSVAENGWTLVDTPNLKRAPDRDVSLASVRGLFGSEPSTIAEPIIDRRWIVPLYRKPNQTAK